MILNDVELLRGHLAAHAMQGILSNQELLMTMLKSAGNRPTNEVIAENAITMANTLIDKLYKKQYETN